VSLWVPSRCTPIHDSLWTQHDCETELLVWRSMLNATPHAAALCCEGHITQQARTNTAIEAADLLVILSLVSPLFPSVRFSVSLSLLCFVPFHHYVTLSFQLTRQLRLGGKRVRNRGLILSRCQVFLFSKAPRPALGPTGRLLSGGHQHPLPTILRAVTCEGFG
jgi:hypothetical protein